MVQRRNTLNNMSIQTYRRNPLYKAIITDLALEGVIARDIAEAMLGYEIPSFIKGPSAMNLASEPKGKKAASVSKEDEDEEE